MSKELYQLVRAFQNFLNTECKTEFSEGDVVKAYLEAAFGVDANASDDEVPQSLLIDLFEKVEDPERAEQEGAERAEQRNKNIVFSFVKFLRQAQYSCECAISCLFFAFKIRENERVPDNLPNVLDLLKSWSAGHFSALGMSDWANLPDDILDEIMKKMCYAEFSTLCAVCKSWRFIYINRFCCFSRNIPLGVPVLLLNTCKQDSNSHKFVKMSGELASGQIFMPEAANMRVCGSSWGWLVLASIDNREVSLLNPFTERVIRLPSMNTFTTGSIYVGKPNIPHKGFGYIRKAILSMNPGISKQDCIVMTIVGERRKLSYCRIGDKKWTNVEGYIKSLTDIIYYEGKFYGTTNGGVLISFNIIDPNSTMIVSLGLSIDYDDINRKHLVMASGRLLLVYRTPNYKFKVYSLNKCGPRGPPALSHKFQYDWFETDSIGDQLLFIGNNDSFSLPSQRHSGRANCIYFTENASSMLESDFHNNFFGMYDIAKKSTWLFNGNAENEPFPSFWMRPTPW